MVRGFYTLLVPFVDYERSLLRYMCRYFREPLVLVAQILVWSKTAIVFDS